MNKTFVIPGLLKHPNRRRRQEVSLFIEAEDREDARFQVHHGVIEMNVRQSYPEAVVEYDLRKMRCLSK